MRIPFPQNWQTNHRSKTWNSFLTGSTADGLISPLSCFVFIFLLIFPRPFFVPFYFFFLSDSLIIIQRWWGGGAVLCLYLMQPTYLAVRRDTASN